MRRRSLEPSASDVAEAEAMVAKTYPTWVRGSEHWRIAVDFRARHRANSSRARFEFLYGDGAPRTHHERAVRAAHESVRATDAASTDVCDATAAVRRYEQRALDAEMLDDFFGCVERRLLAYQRMIELAVDSVREIDEPGFERSAREELREAAAQILDPMEMSRIEQQKVRDFIFEHRPNADRPVELGGTHGACAQDAAMHLFVDLAERWRMCEVDYGGDTYDQGICMLRSDVELFSSRVLKMSPAGASLIEAAVLLERAAVWRAFRAKTRCAGPEVDAPGTDAAPAPRAARRGTRSGAARPSPKRRRVAAKGIRWQDAMQRMESIIESFVKWPGKLRLAREVGCAPSTAGKAINNSKILTRFRKVMKSAPKEVATDPRAIDRIASTDSREEQLNTLVAEQAADQRRDARKGARSRSKG